MKPPTLSPALLKNPPYWPLLFLLVVVFLAAGFLGKLALVLAARLKVLL